MSVPSPDRESVILLHRPDGHEIVLNADLIESIESSDTTTITFFDGRTVVVAETCHQVMEAVKSFRAEVLAAAEALQSGRAELTVVPFRSR